MAHAAQRLNHIGLRIALALALPVLDVRLADKASASRMVRALGAMARRPIEHVRLERVRADREGLDDAVMALSAGAELRDEMWSALLASVALRDRYLLPSV